jgi:pilin isopeptide linkage protein
MTPDTRVAEGATNSDGLKLYQGVSLGDDGKAEISFSSGDTTVNDSEAKKDKVSKTAEFDLSNVTFTTNGVYRYVVEEQKPETGSSLDFMTYDSTRFTVDVAVGFVAGDGETKDHYEILDIVSSATCGKVPVIFTNTCSSDFLEIRKSVTGTMGDKDKDFDFTLNIAADDFLKAGTMIEATIFRKDNTTEQVKVAVGTDYDFKLKDTEYLRIEELHYGVTYTATEKKYSDDAYTCTVYTTENGTELGDPKTDGTIENSIVAGGNKELFVNNKDYKANTGITLDVVPYVLVLLAAAAGAVLFFARKRRTV